MYTAPLDCNAFSTEPQYHNKSDGVNEVGYTPEGWLNIYALGCGYVERIDKDNCWLSLWQEGCYHVRFHDFTKNERVCWETFEDVNEARAFFAEIILLKDAVDTAEMETIDAMEQSLRVEPWPEGMATETVHTILTGIDVEPVIGLKLGTRYFYGMIIAGADFADPDDEGTIYSVVILLNEKDRIPNERNYLVAHMQMGKLFNITEYPNLVLAVKAYTEEYD